MAEGGAALQKLRGELANRIVFYSGDYLLAFL